MGRRKYNFKPMGLHRYKRGVTLVCNSLLRIFSEMEKFIFTLSESSTDLQSFANRWKSHN